ncbi:hypothetical protein LMG18090_04713 [Ralstonia mannitolilytica]|uniref:hypothetical protein n=1 Tax=Ralstonia mannitolilytica TaxID=105219 RepID=UPI000B266051|nr:hypothetical protein [Ralstonia mannitolilytica]CAJ0804975.1 hypothetical protein LMG18090_04713 [Ralstonia mannitolilytica]
MTTIRALLVGGPRDGEWISVLDDMPSVVLPDKPPRVRYGHPSWYRNDTENRVLYRREILCEGQRKHIVFYYGEPGELLETLINGYRKPNPIAAAAIGESR